MRLLERVTHDLSVELPCEVTTAAALLAAEVNTVAVLFYGSVLRSGDLDDVLDFYVLTNGSGGSSWRRALHAILWPDVTFRRFRIGGRAICAKVATMPLTTFERAASGRLLDTTIWTRFAQPCALVWTKNMTHAPQVTEAVAAAIVTAARFAAAIGPRKGRARDFWLALFAATYRTEFRIERAHRSLQIVDHDVARYDVLLPAAWHEGGIPFDNAGGLYLPQLSPVERKRLISAWRVRAAAGKLLNIARLIKAGFTFEGAARYALRKIERHAGVHIAATPWRERHPILAAPAVLWRVLRASAR